MPYISLERRTKIDKLIRNFFDITNDISEGDLNYIISRTIHEWISTHDDGLRYHVLNRAIGVLECAKLELYRKVAAPYEDNKRNEHGPVSYLDEK